MPRLYAASSCSTPRCVPFFPLLCGAFCGAPAGAIYPPTIITCCAGTLQQWILPVLLSSIATAGSLPKPALSGTALTLALTKPPGSKLPNDSSLAAPSHAISPLSCALAASSIVALLLDLFHTPTQNSKGVSAVTVNGKSSTRASRPPSALPSSPLLPLPICCVDSSPFSPLGNVHSS
jgi:hypothetical protein